MSEASVVVALERALRLSQQLAQLADAGDAVAAVALDAERRLLLRAARTATGSPAAAERALLAQIAALNDCALGRLEHRLRIKARELDIAKTGRLAVAAYAATG
jgi:pyrimidine deaminase RibD-like protein